MGTVPRRWAPPSCISTLAYFGGKGPIYEGGPYTFVNPESGKYEYKKSYCELATGETLACVGIHAGGQ